MLDPIKLGSSTFKTHNGQKCHVGYIRLSDWSIQKILRSDWSAPNRCHILLLFCPTSWVILKQLDPQRPRIDKYIDSSFIGCLHL